MAEVLSNYLSFPRKELTANRRNDISCKKTSKSKSSGYMKNKSLHRFWSLSVDKATSDWPQRKPENNAVFFIE